MVVQEFGIDLTQEALIRAYEDCDAQKSIPAQDIANHGPREGDLAGWFAAAATSLMQKVSGPVTGDPFPALSHTALAKYRRK